ncbi:peptidoglycan recognition protein family protein [Thermomonospora catenispora]|uniref:peptidoglycan recognition protein family protein n=1 Tax=Thermomonospora catenispora TaxID=2493090 RepID=UPI00111D2EF4|nr:peptidoglycan recognition family protein [Thermomonospora catenispora]TNY37697.1 N-acetylmuramoyl-L-alanine amidase [Thermomonospora catenispora]
MTGRRGHEISRRVLLGGTAGAGLMATFPPRAEGVTVAQDRGGDRLQIHTRKAWKARPPRRPAQVLDRAPDRIIIHHTATPNTKDFSKEQAYRLSRIIQRFHMEELGWDDIGEQLTISRGGYVMEGRNRSLAAIRARRHVMGAQLLGHNHHTIGIENEGTYSKDPVPAQLWSSLVDTCVWLCDVYDLNPSQAIRAHRDFGETDCPGDALYGRLPELREEVAHRLHRKGGRVSPLALHPADASSVRPLIPPPRGGGS